MEVSGQLDILAVGISGRTWAHMSEPWRWNETIHWYENLFNKFTCLCSSVINNTNRISIAQKNGHCKNNNQSHNSRLPVMRCSSWPPYFTCANMASMWSKQWNKFSDHKDLTASISLNTARKSDWHLKRPHHASMSVSSHLTIYTFIRININLKHSH
jgi:hypothetical protein